MATQEELGYGRMREMLDGGLGHKYTVTYRSRHGNNLNHRDIDDGILAKVGTYKYAILSDTYGYEGEGFQADDVYEISNRSYTIVIVE
jgi:hypothetical protein